MSNRYLIVDPEIFQTGIRDKYKGFISIEQLEISDKLASNFNLWLTKYHQIIENRPQQVSIKFHELDIEGFELMENLQQELGNEYKLEYFSDLQAKKSSE